MTPPLTQGQRSARTRAELLRSARERFFCDGYHGASLDDVARDAGYTKGAVYATFKNKAELFLAVCDVVFEERLEQLRSLFAIPPDRRLDALAEREVDPRDDAWLLLCIEFWVSSARRPEHLAEFAQIYRRMREGLVELAGDQPSPLGPERWAIVTLALTNGLALERLVQPDAIPGDLLAATQRLIMEAA
jgi:AcrR family transcriptional regulator